MKHPSYHAQHSPDKIAYQMAPDGDALTYRQLDQRSNQGAHLLRSLGVNQGDHIALIMENRLDFMEICWAAQRSGIFYTAISRYLSPDEAAFIVKDCGAKVFIASDAYLDATDEYANLIGPDISLFMVGETKAPFLSWTDAVSRMPVTPIRDETLGLDMLYSSGTTGRPKGITRIFEPQPIDTQLPLLTLLCEQISGMDDTTVYLSPAPSYHAAPLRFLMMVGALGGTAYIMDRFDAETFLALVEKHKVTHTQVVPTMFVRLLKLPQDRRAKYDVTSLLTAVHAAAPCPQKIKSQMIDWWGPILIEYYAGTEANGATICTSQEWLAHPGTVGKSLAGTIRIFDPDGNEVETGKVGDVYFESDLTFSYHNDPEKTKAAFSRPGCSTLGDVGYLNDEGFLFLTDRASYTIISGGVNIYPQECEDLLILHPAVADVAVFGVPNEDLGEEVKAVVQPEPGQIPGPELAAELHEWCSNKLSRLKVPRSIDFRKELPRTATGKLVKRHLKDEYWNAARDQG